MNPVLDRDTWRRNRGSYIGGSDLAAILGLLPESYGRNAGTVYVEKVRAQERMEQDDETIDPEVDNRFTYWGQELEGAVIRWYKRTTGFEVETPGLQLFRHPEHEFIGGTIDGAARTEFGDRYIVEAKCTDAFYQAREKIWGDQGTDQVPPWFVPQAMQYMMVRAHEGFDTRCDFPVLIGGNDPRLYHVPYDRDLAEQLIEVQIWFWGCVTSRTPPPIDYSAKNATKLMRRIYNKIAGEPKILSGPEAVRAAGLIYARDYAHEEEKRWGAIKERCTAEMLAIAGNAPRVELQLPGAKKPLAIIRSPREARINPSYPIAAHHVLQFDPYKQPARAKVFAELEDANAIEEEKQKQIGGDIAEVTGEAI